MYNYFVLLLILKNLKDIINKVNYKGRQLNKFLTNLQNILLKLNV